MGISGIKALLSTKNLYLVDNGNGMPYNQNNSLFSAVSA
jgi:hypothetical protein